MILGRKRKFAHMSNESVAVLQLLQLNSMIYSGKENA